VHAEGRGACAQPGESPAAALPWCGRERGTSP
jgi:hypothetical protein